VHDTGSRPGRLRFRKASHIKETKPQRTIWNAELSEVEDFLNLGNFRGHLVQFVNSMAWLAEQKRKAILQTLHFSQIKERDFSVAEAHNSTLEWIFEEKNPSKFVKWLQENGGIYTGLPAKQDLESLLLLPACHGNESKLGNDSKLSHRPPEYDSLLEGMGRGE
jgi:hypothetical protein